ncbi:MAG: cupin domain-containing protein [Lachnospiraceae bacterium]|nr:cupin domain-containing protein [Prevotella sp.]MCM1074881.1 cupin domain-containing protein [Ruminococcus sp.]MCM1223487.1 cupin domain-containing protein [Lachnospiraceae bacterium]
MLKTDIKFAEVFDVKALAACNREKVQFKEVFGSENGGVVLLGFCAGQALAEHQAPAEVMINVLEGEIEFTMLGTPHLLKAGQAMLMGAAVPHSVKALKDSKVMLIKVKP